jgi:CPA2 family monovalent cation:H+ antiporter-2
MELWRSISELIEILSIALLAGIIFIRLRQVVTTGYILVGLLLGPGGLGIINAELAGHLSELGVALLLFVIGLEFSWKRLKAFGLISILGGSLQVGLTLMAVMFVAFGLRQSFSSALVWGGAIALSSTAIVLRTLIDRAELDSVSGRSSMAILLFQDMAVVILLLLVSSLEKSADILMIGKGLSVAALKSLVLVAGLFFLARYVIPAIFPRAAARGGREQLIMFVLVVAMGSAYVAHAMGLPPTLGAFLAGIMLGESYFAPQMRADIISFEALFLTLFFTSIGMLADLRWISSHIGLVLLTVGFLIIFKGAIAGLVVFLFRRSIGVALTSGLALANIGEFAFVLAGIALGKGVITEESFRLLVAASVFSMLIAPYLIGAGGFLLNLFKWPGLPDVGEKAQGHGLERLSAHTIVVGYGPVGRKVAEALQNIGSEVVVIDLNPALAAGKRLANIHFLFGDADREEVLLAAGIKKARAIVFTIPDPGSIKIAIQQARKLASDISILSRARYSISVKELKDAGADMVVDEETTTGDELARQVVLAAGLPAECVKGGELCRLP